MDENKGKEGIKLIEFRYPKPKSEINKDIKKIIRLLKKGHYSYEQAKYIFKRVRQKLELKPTRTSKGVKEHLSQEEANKLIDYAYQLRGDLGLMLKVLLFTGARVNEFVNIRMSDVHLAEKKIYLAMTKGDKPRYVPIFDFYLHELKLYMDKENRIEGHLFESSRHDKYTPRRIQQIVKGLCHEIGVTKQITPHRLRATIATWLFDKGMSKDDIQLFLGHEKPETTQIYIRGSVRQIGDVGNKLLSGEDNKLRI